MKITLYNAMSINGFVTDANGSEDFLDHINWQMFCNYCKEAGLVIMSSRAYIQTLSWGKNRFENDLEGVTVAVISRSDTETLEGHQIFGTIEEAIDYYNVDFQEAIFTAGGTLNQMYFENDLFNSLIINIEPSIVSGGTPLTKASTKTWLREYQLISTRVLENQVVELTYRK